MDPDHIDLRLRIPPPYPLHDPFRRQYYPGRAHEQFHHLELPAAEPLRPLSALQRTAPAVQFQIAEAKHGRFIIPCPPQHGPHPCKQFVRIKRLGQIVIRAGIEARHPVVLFSPGCQQHDRGEHALVPQTSQHLQAVHAGHHDIQNNGIISPCPGIIKSRSAIVNSVHSILIFLQKYGQHLCQIQFILSNQKTHSHSLHFLQL